MQGRNVSFSKSPQWTIWSQCYQKFNIIWKHKSASQPSPKTKNLFTDLNDRNDEDETLINCEYYDYTTPIPTADKKKKAIFHLNIASLNLHKEELETSLSLLGTKFDIIGISETKFIKGTAPIVDPKLPGYKHHHTPTESTKGGVLMYIREGLSYSRRGKLENLMYKSKELESIFYEVENPGKKMKFMVAFINIHAWTLTSSMNISKNYLNY